MFIRTITYYVLSLRYWVSEKSEMMHYYHLQNLFIFRLFPFSLSYFEYSYYFFIVWFRFVYQILSFEFSTFYKLFPSVLFWGNFICAISDYVPNTVFCALITTIDLMLKSHFTFFETLKYRFHFHMAHVIHVCIHPNNIFISKYYLYIEIKSNFPGKFHIKFYKIFGNQKAFFS